MESVEVYRKRIANTEDMHSVVKTMKTLSAVSIRQYEAAVESLEDYSRTLEIGFAMLLRHRRMNERSRTHAVGQAAIVFGSAQGMCGQFNEEIVAASREHLQDPTDASRSMPVLAIGGRIHGLLLDAGIEVVDHAELPGSISGVTTFVQSLLPSIEDWTRRGNIARLDVLHHHRVSAARSEVVRVRLLPPDFDAWAEAGRSDGASRTLPMHTMEFDTLLRSLVRQYLFVALYRACAESLASEHARRIAAMQSAEKSIDQRLDELRGRFHQLRQTRITEEILDVITGYEALLSDEASMSSQQPDE